MWPILSGTDTLNEWWWYMTHLCNILLWMEQKYISNVLHTKNVWKFCAVKIHSNRKTQSIHFLWFCEVQSSIYIINHLPEWNIAPGGKYQVLIETIWWWIFWFLCIFFRNIHFTQFIFFYYTNHPLQGFRSHCSVRGYSSLLVATAEAEATTRTGLQHTRTRTHTHTTPNPTLYYLQTWHEVTISQGTGWWQYST